MQVFKFGGLALQDADSIRNVSDIIAKNTANKLLVVVSATGKSTRLLFRYAESCYYKHGNESELFGKFRDRHVEILKGLSIEDEAYNTILKPINEAGELTAEQGIDFARFFDETIAYGEIVSSMILSACLRQSGIANTWIDIREILLTDNNYSAANVIHSKSRERAQELKEHQLVITQGFIGRSEEGFTSTLGFEGSDYSASLLANYLDAKKVLIWKDVPGIMSADPKSDSAAVKLDSLSYEEAIEYAYAGAKVLHPKSIKPLQNKNIPLEIRSFLQAGKKGSIIQAENTGAKKAVVIQNKEICLFKIRSRDFSFIPEEHLGEILRIFTHFGAGIKMMHQTAISADICIEQDELKISRIMDSLSDDLMVEKRSGLTLLSIFHYNDQIIREKTKKKKVLIENRAKNIYRVLFEPENDS